MKNSTNQIQGFAFLCNTQGIIKQVLRDDMNVASLKPEGKLFFNLVDPGSRSKAMNFFIETKSKDVALNYQLNISVEGQMKTLSFVGVMFGTNPLVIGATNQHEVLKFTNSLQEINNEQANTIRRLMKEKVELQHQNQQGDESSYEDLTSLNNELVNLQRELAKKNAELERLNEMKNRFLGMAAHDLRSPLAIIHSYSEFLIQRATSELSPRHLKFLNNIYDTSQFMLSLVDDLLDVSKIEAGKLQLNRKTFNLADLAQKNAELNQTLANKKNITLNLSCREQNIFIYGDWHKLEQVFNNLISNAIKFSPGGGTIHVVLDTRDDRAYVSVTDEGMGIPIDEQQKLFQPFQKLSVSGTAGEQGTGLGLTIVKRIVEGHQGTIWVESEEGQGTSFTFTLPLMQQKATDKNRKDKKMNTLPDWQNKTIFLIEDDFFSMQLIKELLKPSGVQIYTYANGNEGLSALQDNVDVNLILLDIGLPDMDGREIIRAVRKSHPQLPVIVQTAKAMVSDKENILSAGASAYITKPLDRDTLLSLIREYLGA